MTRPGGTELFTPAEMAFLAKEETIQIQPKVHLRELHFLNVQRPAGKLGMRSSHALD